MDIEFKLSTELVESAYPVRAQIVEPSDTLGRVFELLQRRNSGCVLICEDGELKGIFTERDAIRLLHRGFDTSAPISDVMVEEPITIRPSATIGAAILRMSSGGYRRLPIVDADGHVLGLLQTAGVLHYLVEQIPKTIYNLPPVDHTVMQEREGP
jgi:CBS domain-containing protein